MPIRIQIVTEKWNPISAAIRFTTRSWASHVEFVETHFRFTLGARSKGGVAERSCSLDHYSKIEQFTINHENPEPIIRNAFEWARTQEGKPYDYSAIFGIAADRNIHDEQRWFCSELIAVSFEKAGFPLLSTRPSDIPWRITPRDLLLSRQLVWIASY